MRFIAAAFFVVLINTLVCLSQPYRKSIEWITDKQAFTGPTINTLLKDSSGAMWLGTVDGLFRWNGKEMDQYHHDVNTPSTLPHNVINKIIEKDKNTLLIATSGGFSVFNTIDHTCKNYYGDIKNKDKANLKTVNDFVLLNDSIVIISFMYSGLHRLNLYTWQATFLERTAIPGNLRHFKKLLVTNDGMILCAAMGQLLLLDQQLRIKSGWENVPATDATLPFDNQFLTLLADTKNKDIIWTGTWGGGLKQLNIKTGEWNSYYFEDKNLPQNIHNIVTDITYSNDSIITVSNSQNYYDFHTGNHLFTLSDWNKEKSPQGISIKHLYKTTSGEEWVFNEHEFGHVSEKRPELDVFPWNSGVNTLSFVKNTDPQSLEAFTWYEHRSYLRYNIFTGKLIKEVSLPLLDKKFIEIYNATSFNDRFILAATKEGIYTYDRLEEQIKPVFLPDDTTTSLPYIVDIFSLNNTGDFLMTDAHSTIWRCHIGIKNNSLALSTLMKVNAPKTHFIQQMKSGRIYIAGQDISYFDERQNKLNKVCRLPGSWQYATIYQMLEDEYQKLWITFDQSGVLRIDLKNPEKIETLRQGKNTPSTFFDAINDHAGGLWTISHYGLHRISSVMKIYNYQQRDLKNVLPQSSFYQFGNDSWLYTGSEFIRLTAPHSENQLPACTVEFRELLVNGQPAGKRLNQNTLTLDHTSNLFSLKLSAIDLYHPDRIFYRYQTPGVDPKMVDLANNNYISYSNLAPGNYMLTIEAYDPETGRVRDIRKLNITIVPAWYQRIAVKAAGLLLLVLIATGVGLYFNRRQYRIRLNELQKQKELEVMRQSISKDIHDELGSSITRITRSTELLLRQMDNRSAMETQLTRLGNLSKSLGKSLSEIVWAVNPRQDKLENFILYTRQYIQELGEENNLVVSVKLPSAGLEMLLLPKVQRNLFLLIKEACNNVVKYSGANTITLTIETDLKKDLFSIRIADNGQGFDPNQIRPFSNGLTNMRNRCEELGLLFELDTHPGKGTTINARGSLRKLEQKSY